MTDNDEGRILINIPADEHYIEILGHRIDGFESFEAFCEFLKNYAVLEETVNRQKAEIEELTEKLECLLCHATGSKLSKSTYSLRTMEVAVNDEVQKCCEEAKAEAVKEFAERLKEQMLINLEPDCWIWQVEGCIDNLVKEMVGETDV